MDDTTRARLDELLTAVAERRMSVGHALAQAEDAGILEPEPEPEPAGDTPPGSHPET